jgi:hypothetical protein
MKIFLLDLWHDLRAKRLWPVALVLGASLIAVPVVLSKSPDSQPAPAPEAAAPSTTPDKEKLAALSTVKLGESEEGKGSTLNTFDPDNPFVPPKAIAKKSRQGNETQAGSTIESTQSTGADTGGSAGGDTGSAGGGSTPSTGGYTPPTGGDTTPSDGEQTTVYKYVVDVTFTANGRSRRIRGLDKLDMLPNEAAPYLIFMGVTPKGSDAVFLVDSSLSATGEGRCRPSGKECAFAYIGAGSEHVFNNEDGDTYTLRIDEIRKVKLTASSSSDTKGARAEASLGQGRRFVPPLLADLVVVASDSLDDSNRDSDRR